MGQAEVGRKKNFIVPIHSFLTRNRDFQKNNKKIKKHQYGFFSSQNGTGEAENVRKKILVRIHSNPTRNMELQKNSKKIQKIKKHHYGFFSNQNGTVQDENEWKKIFSFRSIPSRPGIGNSKKITKKCKKLKNISMALFQPKTGWDRLRLREK